MPFADGAFACVYSGHMIEHIGHRSTRECVRHYHRVLWPSGILRVSTPKLGVFTSMYGTPATSPIDSYIDFLTHRLQPPSASTKKAFAINNYFDN